MTWKVIALLFFRAMRLKVVAEACQAPHFPNTCVVVLAIANEDAT